MVFYIIIAIVIFGVLIAIHEFGHFISAKALGVRVNEFSIGMGPALFKRQKGETLYSLRVFPIGGFCAMEGEDELTEDPKAFTAQPLWKRLIILVAGSFANFLAGFIVLIILFGQASAFSNPVITGFVDGFALQGAEGLQVGDRISQVDGENIYIFTDVNIFFGRQTGNAMDLVIERDGEKIALDDFPLYPKEYVIDGEVQTRYGINFEIEPASFGRQMQEAWMTSVDFVRLIRVSLVDLFTGAAGLRDLSGPIGIVETIGQVGAQSGSAGDAALNIAYLAALIAINLAVMNLLPIPALDGGRIFLLLIGGIFTLVTKRKLNPKYEGYIHAAGMVCLLALMVIVAVSDVMKLVGA